VNIGSPSFGDHENFIKLQRNKIQAMLDDAQKLSQTLATDSDMKTVLDLCKDIARCGEAVNSAATLDRKIGTVFAASGLKLHSGGNILDWALIELLPERVGNNKVGDNTLSWYQSS
jgi:hypothetical protein